MRSLLPKSTSSGSQLALASLMLLLTSTPGQAQNVDLTTDWGSEAMRWRGNIGVQYTVNCPPGGDATSSVWGTGIYTDNSQICSAAVHAGAITPATGGQVTIEIRPGEANYSGSTQNGVSSQDWGPFDGSFVIISKSGKNGKTTPSSGSQSGEPADWSTSATNLRELTGSRATFACPPGEPTGSVWGFSLYTDNSSICTAGAQLGVIDPAVGGAVTIEIWPGAPAYFGSTRNEITSADWGEFDGSFVIVP